MEGMPMSRQQRWGKKPFLVKAGVNYDERGKSLRLHPIYVVDNEPDLSGPMPVL